MLIVNSDSGNGSRKKAVKILDSIKQRVLYVMKYFHVNTHNLVVYPQSIPATFLGKKEQKENLQCSAEVKMLDWDQNNLEFKLLTGSFKSFPTS